MTFDILRKHFADYLSRSQIKLDITGFDMDAFSKAVNEDLKNRLDTVEYVAFEDEAVMSSDQKIQVIQALFQNEFLQ